MVDVPTGGTALLRRPAPRARPALPLRSAPSESRRTAGAHRRTPARLPGAPLALAAAVVALVALVPRLLLVRSTLPYLEHPDEPSNIGLGVRMAAADRLVPGKYNYPSLLSDLVAGATHVHEWLTGPVDIRAVSRYQNAGITRTDLPGLVLGLRLVSVLASVVTCLVLLVVVARWTGRLAPAVAAGLLAAAAPLAIENGVLVTPDVHAGLGVTLALAGALAVLARPARGRVLAAGAAAGLAAGAKYNAGLVLLAVLAACLLAQHRAGRRPPRPATGARLLAAAQATAAAAVAFVVTTPAVLFEPGRVAEGIRFEMTHYATGQPGFEGDAGRFYLAALLADEPVLLGLALLGALLGIRCLVRAGTVRSVLAGHRTLVVLAFAVPYALLLAGQQVRFERILMPLLPALVLLAGPALAALGTAAARGRWALPPVRRRLTALVPVVVAAAVLVPLPLVVADVRRELDQPAKAWARAWLAAHLPAGSTVVVEAYGPHLPTTADGGFALVEVPFATDSKTPDDAAAYVLSEKAGGRFTADRRRYPDEAGAYDALRAGRCTAARFAEGPWLEILVPCPPAS